MSQSVGAEQRLTTRAATSEPRFVEYPRAAEGAPSVVMVVLDDVGFAQLGCFGAGFDLASSVARLARPPSASPLARPR